MWKSELIKYVCAQRLCCMLCVIGLSAGMTGCGGTMRRPKECTLGTGVITQPITPHSGEIAAMVALLPAMRAPDLWIQPSFFSTMHTLFGHQSSMTGICITLPGLNGQPFSAESLVDAGWEVYELNPPIERVASDVMLATEGMGASVRGVTLSYAIDQMLFVAADVARAQVQQLRQRRPELQNAPILVVGESLGALMMVGLLATGRVPYDAAVLVAGGGSCLDVATNSLLVAGPIPPELLTDPAFQAAYAKTCRLDPLYAAPTLRECPIVFIKATSDMIVPVSAQERLRIALGAPCTFVYEGGHVPLFRDADNTFVPVLKEIGEMAIARVAAENAARAVVDASSTAGSGSTSD